MAEARWKDLFTLELLPRAVLVCFGIWLNAADSLVTTTIMPSVVRAIGGYAYFAWPVATYLLGSILGGACAGHFAHARGLRTALIAASLPYIFGCLLSAFAGSMAPFLLGRFMQGIGSGAVVGLCYVAVNALFAKPLYGRLFGLLAGVWGIATLFGPLLGGLFAAGRQWQILFFAFAVQGAIFAAAIPLLVPRGPAPPEESAVPLRTLGLLGVAIVANLAAEIVASIAAAVGLLVLTGLFLVFALRADAKAAAHLFPRSIARRGDPAAQGYAAIFLLNASTVGFGLYGAAILQTAYGLSPLFAGYIVGLEAMGWTVAALVVAGRPQAAEPFWIRAGATVALAGVVSLIFTLPSLSLPAVAISATTMGAGFGFFYAFLTRRLQEFLPPPDRTVGASAIPCVQMLGTAIGSAVCGVIANGLGVGSGFTRANVLSVGMWLFICAVPVALLGWFSAIRISRGALPGSAATPGS
ncbi:MAG: MFS transporter [Proteobacteria bacterium]|nr:MFS transporter [Pseudomonadota bacterium]